MGFLISAIEKLNSPVVKVSESKPPLTNMMVPKLEAVLEDYFSNEQVISSLKPVRRVHVEATRSVFSIMKPPGMPIFK